MRRSCSSPRDWRRSEPGVVAFGQAGVRVPCPHTRSQGAANEDRSGRPAAARDARLRLAGRADDAVPDRRAVGLVGRRRHAQRGGAAGRRVDRLGAPASGAGTQPDRRPGRRVPRRRRDQPAVDAGRLDDRARARRSSSSPSCRTDSPATSSCRCSSATARCRSSGGRRWPASCSPRRTPWSACPIPRLAWRPVVAVVVLGALGTGLGLRRRRHAVRSGRGDAWVGDRLPHPRRRPRARGACSATSTSPRWPSPVSCWCSVGAWLTSRSGR